MDGVALVTMDIENMYNNITEDLGMKAVKCYLEGRQYQSGINFMNVDPEVSTNSLMMGLKLCIQKKIIQIQQQNFQTKRRGGYRS